MEELESRDKSFAEDDGRYYDITIIGAGVVGSVIARELSKYGINVVQSESSSDVGMRISKANFDLRLYKRGIMKDQQTIWTRLLPSLLVVLHLALAYLLMWLIPLPLVAPPILHLGGLLLAFYGFLLGMLAMSSFRRASQTVQKRGVVGLVTTGVYRFSRNPIYLGFVLMLAGIPLNAGSYWGVILIPVMMLVFNRLVIQPEEEFLAKKFGKDYTTYRSQVRRWI